MKYKYISIMFIFIGFLLSVAINYGFCKQEQFPLFYLLIVYLILDIVIIETLIIYFGIK